MYHFIIRQKISRVFAALNHADASLVIDAFAPQFEHYFLGQHAFSGRRTDITKTQQWYERLYRVFPNIQFQIKQIRVSGWPWDTLVAVEWTDSYTLRDGLPHDNGGVHLIRLQWGRCTSVRIYCDTARLNDNLAIQAAAGCDEALFEPIE